MNVSPSTLPAAPRNPEAAAGSARQARASPDPASARPGHGGYASRGGRGEPSLSKEKKKAKKKPTQKNPKPNKKPPTG